MTRMIDFAIDLGTTNSLVAKFNKGAIEVFKNPIGFKETLPSVIGFRKDRILVGEKARTYAENDPDNVVDRFKRKMGTTESFKIESLGQSKTPVELSALVLKELKTFVHTGETPEAVVITIPASFDMVQSNATKEAGYAAGFRQVVLFQEPIAASLAYANKEKSVDLRNSQWIVYDLGGGTLDVALVRIVEGELKIVDHEGDNYLGGSDFDALVVERIIAPQLEKRGKFTDLLVQMKSREGRFNRLWRSLLLRAEEAKIELSTHGSAEIELRRINVVDENGKTIDDDIPITRSEFEAVIKDSIDNTAAMLKTILTRNSLRPEDLQFVLMVGGSTYIPLVRKRIEELLGIPVNTGIDPTNAIAIGAAYFAGTKELDLGEKPAGRPATSGALRVKVSYNRASQEREEMFGAKVEGDITGLSYRIIREDGGYDSGLKKLTARIDEDLPLQEGACNFFVFTVYDRHNNPVPTDLDPIQITQGMYSVAGQMLPQDLSLVVDGLNTGDTGDTTLHCIFVKNSVIPAKYKKTVTVNRTVVHGSEDDVIHVIVVEGPSENHHTANRKQGHLMIRGKQLKRDVPRGTDIDLTFELSESQDLSVTAYINPSGPQFSGVYKPRKSHVDVKVLAEEVHMLEARLDEDMAEAMGSENYEFAGEVKKLREKLQELDDAVTGLASRDVTDDKTKLDNTKRKIAQEVHQLTVGTRLERLRDDYRTVRDEATEIVNESGNDLERRQLREIVTREHTFLNSTNPKKLEAAIDDLRHVRFQILRRTPAFLVGWFQHLVERREVFNDQLQANNLIEAGKKYVAAEDWDRLDGVIGRLYSLLPEEVDVTEKDAIKRYYTGIRIS
ncbi:MAG: Hsp70 family protein [Planctomycetia bacterium]|nr:Hsp70 family protein [Planctomycetia bacterium]